MDMTVPVDGVNSKHEGYIVNAGFSTENTKVISGLIEYLKLTFGDVLSVQDEDSLHITLLDWVAPLVDYGGEDKSELYESIKDSYDTKFTELLSHYTPILVHFSEIEIHPTTIILKGQDDGSFQKIRDEFVKSVDLLPGTKMPPNIVHTSLARFVKAVPIDDVRKALENYKINFNETVSSFRLINSHTVPLSDPEIIKVYSLEN